MSLGRSGRSAPKNVYRQFIMSTCLNIEGCYITHAQVGLVGELVIKAGDAKDARRLGGRS